MAYFYQTPVFIYDNPCSQKGIGYSIDQMTKLSDIGHLYRSFMSSGKVEILDMNCLSFTDVLEMKQTVIEQRLFRITVYTPESAYNRENIFIAHQTQKFILHDGSLSCFRDIENRKIKGVCGFQTWITDTQDIGVQKHFFYEIKTKSGTFFSSGLMLPA